ncbi:hypothetical protein NEUTE2DRAFT_53821, partial [Neurospora tetrasperma FGSC 2509]
VYIDYRSINNVILSSWYPLSLIKEIFNIIYKAKVFIKFDIITAFNYICIVEGYK